MIGPNMLWITEIRNNEVYSVLKRSFALIALLVLTSGCSEDEMKNSAKNLISATIKGQDLEDAVIDLTRQKAMQYVDNPTRLAQDLKRIQSQLKQFHQTIVSIWGESEAKRANPKRFEKYTDHYLSRAVIEFDQGVIFIETLDQEQPHKRLADAITMTLLTPDDPRKIELFSDAPMQLEGEPYLLNQVLDHEGRPVRSIVQARQFSTYLVENNLRIRTIHTAEGAKQMHYVEISMVSTHHDIRYLKYSHLVDKYAERYQVSRALIYAIIKTESDFNQYAVSWVPAFGLMQIVPQTAGLDVNRHLHQKDQMPSKTYLFNPENNIEMGIVYIDLLKDNYLSKIRDPLSKEYCIIAAYNGGVGLLLKKFGTNQRHAFDRINHMAPAQVYEKIQSTMPQETRKYVVTVLGHRKSFASG
jgi:membrane-bound lytic murein transglycosylase C